MRTSPVTIRLPTVTFSVMSSAVMLAWLISAAICILAAVSLKSASVAPSSTSVKEMTRSYCVAAGGADGGGVSGVLTRHGAYWPAST